MTETSARLGLPYLAASQSQKHVTVNEVTRRLDALVQANVVSRSTGTEPGAPADGALYILPAGKTGAAWGGQSDLALAYYRDGAWEFLAPSAGWIVHVSDEADYVAYTGSGWVPISELFATFTAFKLVSPFGAAAEIKILEEEVTGLSGASVDTVIEIPAGAIVFNVSERVTTAVTGASSFSVGTAAEPSKFGSGLWAGEGGTNLGVIGPTAFYAATAIRLTAAGADFTGGDVRIAIHYYLPTEPQA